MSDEQADSQPRSEEVIEPALLMTRRDCTVFGAKVFAMCAASAICLAPAPYLASVLVKQPSLWDDMVAHLAVALFIALPPAATFGAAVGFEAYRLAVGSRQPRDIGCLVWVLMGACVTGYATPLFYLQYLRRKHEIVERRPIGWAGPILYALLIVGMAVLCSLNDWADPGRHGTWDRAASALLCGGGGVASLLLSDCIVINMLAQWQRTDRLAVPFTHNIQYSLATLFWGSVALGAYGTGLVLMFQ